MATFLIQVSGHPMRETAQPEYVEGAKGPLMCSEPLVHGEYFNASPYWQEEGFERYSAWRSIEPGDTVFLYCTGSVDGHESSLSHMLTVDSVSLDDEEGARLVFEEVRELEPNISYDRIQREIEAGRLSEETGYCGQEGFNFTEIADSDRDRILELTDPRDPEADEPADSLQQIAADVSQDDAESSKSFDGQDGPHQ